MDSALSSKGQVTIPKAAREHLQLGPGDRVKFFAQSNGTVLLLPKVPMRQPPRRWKGKPVTIEEMNEGIAREATARYRRSLK